MFRRLFLGAHSHPWRTHGGSWGCHCNPPYGATFYHLPLQMHPESAFGSRSSHLWLLHDVWACVSLVPAGSDPGARLGAGGPHLHLDLLLPSGSLQLVQDSSLLAGPAPIQRSPGAADR